MSVEKKPASSVSVTDFCTQLSDAGYLVSVKTSDVLGKFTTVNLEILSPNGEHTTDVKVTGKNNGLHLDRPTIINALTALGFFGPTSSLGSGR